MQAIMGVLVIASVTENAVRVFHFRQCNGHDAAEQVILPCLCVAVSMADFAAAADQKSAEMSLRHSAAQHSHSQRRM